MRENTSLVIFEEWGGASLSAIWQYLIQAAETKSVRANIMISTLSGVEFAQDTVLTAGMLRVISADTSFKNIESIFYFDDALTEAKLCSYLRCSTGELSTISELYKPHLHDGLLRCGCALLKASSALSFRLTLLATCLTYEFERTAFCLWLVVLESEKFARNESDFLGLFLTALVHDVGLLDIDKKFTHYDHDPRSSKDDVQGYYRHIYHSEHFAKTWLAASPKVINGIREHHEVMDGTGYPNGRSGNQLCEYGQHIHMYDTMFSVFNRLYKPAGKNLADLTPIIEINAVTHFGRVAMRVVELLAGSSRSTGALFSPDEEPRLQSEIAAMAVFVETALAIIQDFTHAVGFRHDDRPLFSLQNSFIHISLSYFKLRQRYSRASTPEQNESNQEQAKEEGFGANMDAGLAAEECFLAMREIIFHINKFLYRLRVYRHAGQGESGDMIRAEAEKTVQKLTELNIKLIH